MKKFLPSVAGHYYQNHNGDFSESPTEKDFNEGMGWPVKRGVFVHKVGENRINCPASKVILQVASGITPSEQELQKNKKVKGLGIFIYYLYQECRRQLSQDKILKEEVLKVLMDRIHVFTSKEIEILYRYYAMKGKEMLRGKYLPIKPSVYICASNNPLDIISTRFIGSNLSHMSHNRLIDINKTAVKDAEECIKMMDQANIILLLISDGFINSNWSEQIIENAQRLNKSREKVVIPVICSNINEQNTKKILSGMKPIFLSDKPFYDGNQFYISHQLNDDVVSNLHGIALSGLLRSMIKGDNFCQRFSDEVK